MPYTFRKTELINEKRDVGKGGWKNIPSACSLGQEGFWSSPGQCPAPGVCGYARAEYPQWPGAAHPIPVTGTHFHPGTPACPDTCSCTDHKERSGTKRASKTNQFPDGNSPWWSAFCCQPLDLQIRAETRGRGCSLLPFPSTAAIPQQSHWEAGWQLTLHCLFTVIINHTGVTFPATSFGQHWHGSRPWWVRSAEWMPEGLHPCTWIGWKMPSLHMDPLEDAIPACRAACTSTYNRYEFPLQRKYILIMQTLCAFLKHRERKKPALIFLWNHYSFEIHGKLTTLSCKFKWIELAELKRLHLPNHKNCNTELSQRSSEHYF